MFHFPDGQMYKDYLQWPCSCHIGKCDGKHSYFDTNNLMPTNNNGA